MDKHHPPAYFIEEWTTYLEQHGHEVIQPSSKSSLLISQNGKGRRYRWLLQCTESDTFLITAKDRREIRRQIRQAGLAKQECYLVVKFRHPGGKAVVLPAIKAVKLNRLPANIGGIPWEI